ncbi:MAG: MerR family transcriptional regulator [Chitinophagaceae bacterium]|nr:MerR family transcriptional regulator [Chitinophagaceae bacterium]
MTAPESKYSIKDLESLTGIKSHTIRIWEKRYGLLTPQRTDTNIRHYSNEELRKLLNVSFLVQHGFKISHIAEMPDVDLGEKVKSLNVGSGDSNSFIDTLILGLIDLNEMVIQKTLLNATVKHGFEKTITEIIFPFLHRIGTMWQTGSINPAQEHFISNIIRQKLLAATDGIDTPVDSRLPKTVLFLPDNEMHEFGLLFYNYALRKRGFPVVYLGQAVPTSDLVRIIEITKADVLLGLLTYSINTQETYNTIQHFAKSFHGKILLGNRGNDKLPKGKNIYHFTSLEDVLSLL